MAFKDSNNLFSSFFDRNSYLKKYLLSILALLFLVFFYTSFSKKITQQDKSKIENIDTSIKSSKFSDLKRYLSEKYRSPYKEYKYIIQNNDRKNTQ